MSKKIKSDGDIKIMAEVDDISCWPVATTGRAFKPGTRYNLGSLASLAYTPSRWKRRKRMVFHIRITVITYNGYASKRCKTLRF